MANIQKYFEKFHNTIKLDDDAEVLREKRDAILKKLRAYLRENSKPGFKEIHQGSYKYKVGIETIEDLEFDIDIGLRFQVKDEDYKALEVREWVLNAIENHTKSVESKGPCIRVNYSQQKYHVDLVVYANWTDDLDNEQFRLAHKSKSWLKADPIKLSDSIKEAREIYEGTEDSSTKTDQLRRVTRFLKRWNDVAIPYESEDKPNGLSLLLYSINNLEPTYSFDGNPNDLEALLWLSYKAYTTRGRLIVEKPSPEYEDVFNKLSSDAMSDLKSRFESLYRDLEAAKSKTDPVDACKILRDNQFGDDFPVPKTKDTGKKTLSPAIITSSSSA